MLNSRTFGKFTRGLIGGRLYDEAIAKNTIVGKSYTYVAFGGEIVVVVNRGFGKTPRVFLGEAKCKNE